MASTLIPLATLSPVVTTTAPAPDSLSIRQAERRDLLDILRIEKASFPQPWPYTAFVRFLDDPGFLVATTSNNPSIVGYVVANTIPNHGRPIGHVKDLAVHPDYRRHGIADRLLDRVLSILTTQGVTRTKLEVRRSNESALALYEGHGFELRRVIPSYYDDSEDALVLVADLTDR